MGILLIIWLLGIFGCGYIVTQSFIFQKIRELSRNKYINYFLHCITCFTFWLGLVCTFIYSPSAIFEIPLLVQCLFNGFLGSAGSTIIFNFLPVRFD